VESCKEKFKKAKLSLMKKDLLKTRISKCENKSFENEQALFMFTEHQKEGIKMQTKEEYYTLIQEVRSVLSNSENLKCSCPKTKCEWHGDCRKCVAQHRYFKKHIPNCLQAVFNIRIKEMVQLFEMTAIEDDKTSDEYWDYVRERDNQKCK
jgi:hypothetical protein